MKNHFKPIDKTSGIYCYKETSLNYFLHKRDYIANGAYAIVTGL